MLKNQTLDGGDKIEYLASIAIDRIKTHKDRINKKTYLAYGGGKDSTVTLDLARKAGIEVEPHYHFTTVDPPELTQFIKNNIQGVIWDRPCVTMTHRGGEPQTIKSMFQLIEFKGTPPTRKFRYCCEVLKEYGGRGRTVITGARWEESPSRSQRRMFERCSKDDDTYYLNPIIDWTAQDVWDYIRANKLPYCCLYDEGFTRIGCIGCPKTTCANRLREFSRWPKYYNAYLQCFKRMLKVKSKTHVLQWATKEDVMNWWLYGSHINETSVQCELFG